MKNTILNSGLTSFGGMTHQAFQTLVRALKVASLTVVAGTLALTGSVSAAPVNDTVLTVRNIPALSSVDLTTACSYNLVTDPVTGITLTLSTIAPSNTTDILFFNNGLLLPSNFDDLNSFPNYKPATFTANTSLTTGSIVDQNIGSVIITDNGGGIVPDVLTFAPATVAPNQTNTNALPSTATVPGVTVLGTGATNVNDLLFVGALSNLSFTPGTGTLPNQLSLVFTPSGATGNVDNNGTLAIGTGVTITAAKTLAFTGAGTTTVSGVIAATTGAVTVSAGKVTFGGADLYTGATSVTLTGTLTITGSLSPLSALSTSNTGVLAFNEATGSTITNAIADAGTVAGAETGTNTLTGLISGAGNFLQSGAGTTILSNVSDIYTGTTTVNAGTLQIGGPLAAAIGGGATGTAITVNGGALNESANGVIFGVATTSLTINGGAVTESNTTSNTYTGTTTVNGGSLLFNGTAAITNATSALTLGVNGGSVTLSNTSGADTQTFGLFTVSGGASTINVTVVGDTLALGSAGGTPITGTVDFTGGGVTGTITSANSPDPGGVYGGFATFNGGATWAALAANVLTALPQASYTASVAATSTPGATADVDFQQSNTLFGYGTQSIATLRFNNTTGAGSVILTQTAATTLTLASGGILVTPNFGANTATIQSTGAGGTGGTIRGVNATQGLDIIQDDPTGTLVINSIIADNAGATPLVLSGTGLVKLTGQNTFTGGTFINGSTIQIGTGSAVGGTITPFGSGNVTINNPTTIATDGANGVGLANAYIVNNPNYILNATLTVNVAGATGTTLVLSEGASPVPGAFGNISGTGGLIVNAGGATTGTLVLNGLFGTPVNSYSGATLVQGGTLQAGAFSANNFAFSANSNYTLSAASTLDLNGFSELISSLASTGLPTSAVTNSNATPGTPVTLTVGGNTATAVLPVYSGNLNNGTVNTLAFATTGTVVQTLSGAGSYSGGTTVGAGSTLVVGSATALGGALAATGSTAPTGGYGVVINNGILATTATTGGAVQTINTPGNYVQTAGSVLLLQVASNEGVAPQTGASAGVNYDTLNATGFVGSTTAGAALTTGAIVLNFTAAAPALPGQRFQVASAGAPITGIATPVVNPPLPLAVTTTGNISPLIIPITSYNDNFNGTFANNNITVTLFQPFTTFAGLTPNQNSVATALDTAAGNLFGFNFVFSAPFSTTNGVVNSLSTLPLTGTAKDFFDNIIEGVSLAGGAGQVGHALDELSPQRFELLHNVAYDNYAFDVQSLDDEFARERMGFGGVDTAGFTFNNSQLGPELSQVRSRLLAWSPAPEPGLLSDSSQSVLGGVAMADKKDMKEMAPETPENLWNVFIDGGVDLGDKDGNNDLDHSNYTTGRVRVGADYRVCTDLRVGALFGYGHTDADLDNEGSKAHVDSYTPGVFLTYADKDGFYANGLFTYTANDYNTARDIIIPGVNRTANGSSSGSQFGGDLDGGYDFHRGDWTFGPSAGLTYVNLGIDSFTETGANSADLAINSQSSDSLRSRLGATASYRTEIGSVVLTPHISAYWQHEFLDNGTSITSSFVGLPGSGFAVQTTAGDSDSGLFGAGLDAQLNQTVTLFIDYGAEAGGSTFFGQSATGGVKIGF